jgi:hypothetical protein
LEKLDSFPKEEKVIHYGGALFLKMDSRRLFPEQMENNLFLLLGEL